jgi:CheY-like chemotaxis protein
MRVLCMDDEPLLRELVEEMLQRTARSGGLHGGQSSLDQLRSARDHGTPLNLDITDLGMPHVDGRQVARLARPLNRNRR